MFWLPVTPFIPPALGKEGEIISRISTVKRELISPRKVHSGRLSPHVKIRKPLSNSVLRIKKNGLQGVSVACLVVKEHQILGNTSLPLMEMPKRELFAVLDSSSNPWRRGLVLAATSELPACDQLPWAGQRIV